MQNDSQKVLSICPGGLVEHGQDELYEKFGLAFQFFSRQMVEELIRRCRGVPPCA
jgi:hypothetical protein